MLKYEILFNFYLCFRGIDHLENWELSLNFFIPEKNLETFGNFSINPGIIWRDIANFFTDVEAVKRQTEENVNSKFPGIVFIRKADNHISRCLPSYTGEKYDFKLRFHYDQMEIII